MCDIGYITRSYHFKRTLLNSATSVALDKIFRPRVRLKKKKEEAINFINCTFQRISFKSLVFTNAVRVNYSFVNRTLLMDYFKFTFNKCCCVCVYGRP